MLTVVRKFARSAIWWLHACFLLCLATTTLAEERPNVLWIISDDLGVELGCYGYPEVDTPNVDRLAQAGRIYTRAFATSPVCSSSRSAFQTGRYQTSIGCYHHLTRDKKALPANIETAIDLMRQAGYFISHGNGVAGNKKPAKFGVNYVYDKKAIFDAFDWSHRQPGQPFFAQVHIGEPHRAFKKIERVRSQAPIPPYYPEHPVTRADWSNYLASVEAMDRKVGAILDRLERDGDLDNTLILFFGDHGRPHLRDKQWLYEGGLHTPLILSWPGQVEAGGRTDALTSLLDIMPTTLAAAKVELPALPGLNLLDKQWQGHSAIYAARDRCGDAPDRIRSVRDERFKYIRNFHPEKPYMQLSSYKKLSYPVHTLVKVLNARGEWESPFLNSTRPPEELYDLQSDPYELDNLASNPTYEARLKVMRVALRKWMTESGDQGATQESKSVDIESLMLEKRKWYERTMQKRGLDPEVSDQEYLEWWKRELGLTSP